MNAPVATKLLLEDGTEMFGRAFGATGSVGDEVVFNTGMTGYGGAGAFPPVLLPQAHLRHLPGAPDPRARRRGRHLQAALRPSRVNQPVQDLITRRCYITSQNHGYAVKQEALPDDWEPWFVNVNDGTSEGIRARTRPFFSVQFHPEASPGPEDTAFLFDDFMRLVGDVHSGLSRVCRHRRVRTLAGAVPLAERCLQYLGRTTSSSKECSLFSRRSLLERSGRTGTRAIVSERELIEPRELIELIDPLSCKRGDHFHACRTGVAFAIGVCVAAAVSMAFGDAQAQLSPDNSLRVYAVDIWQDPPQSWGPGRGVYLGNGLVLTAAHVVGSPLAPGRACASPGWTCLRKPSRKANSSAWT